MSELILFIISTLAVFVALMLFPKNVAKQNGATWTIVAVLTIICSWVFFGGIVNLIGVKLNLYSLSAINISLTVAAAVGIAINKKTQKYYVKCADVVMLMGMLVLAVAVGMLRFDVRLDIFAYGADDSVRHFANARDLALTGVISSGKYAMNLIDMVFIRCLAPLLPEIQWYRAFLVADIFLWFMMGAMFWTLIRRFTESRYARILGYGFTFMYMLGYPLLNMMFGFEYLGAGILFITYLLWVIQKMDYREIPEWMSIAFFTLANAAICVSYTQFAPVILLGELVYLVIFFGRKKKLMSVSAMVTLLIGFGAPGALCISYIAPRYWAGLMPVIGLFICAILLITVIIFVALKIRANKLKTTVSNEWKSCLSYMSKNKVARIALIVVVLSVLAVVLYRYVFVGMIVKYATKEGGMALDGSIYREPYANFLILAFPMLMYVADAVKKRKNDAALWMTAGAVIFSAWLLYCVFQGSIGSYYFYKMHFLFWLFLFYCAFRQSVALTGEARRMMTIYLSGVMVLFAVLLTGGENKLIKGHEHLWKDNISSRLFGVYTENMRMLNEGGNVDRDMQTIYSKVAEIVEIRGGVFIPYFGEELRHLTEYYYNLTGQDPKQHPDHLNDKYYPSYDLWSDLQEMGVIYIFVQKDCKSMPKKYLKEFEDMQLIFENDYGKILKLNY